PFFSLYTTPYTTANYTLSLHDALPIFVIGAEGKLTIMSPKIRAGTVMLPDSRTEARTCDSIPSSRSVAVMRKISPVESSNKLLRSEEHTSELQSPCNLVCRLLLEKKKK